MARSTPVWWSRSCALVGGVCEARCRGTPSNDWTICRAPHRFGAAVTTNDCRMDVTPGQVWSVLADGWLYPLWVVGATRVRDVDADWPAKGKQIHHSVGVWPAMIDDTTEVLESEPGHLLRLRARGWPAGEAEVVIRLTSAGPGSHVTIEEDMVSGPGR